MIKDVPEQSRTTWYYLLVHRYPVPAVDRVNFSIPTSVKRNLFRHEVRHGAAVTCWIRGSQPRTSLSYCDAAKNSLHARALTDRTYVDNFPDLEGLRDGHSQALLEGKLQR